MKVRKFRKEDADQVSKVMIKAFKSFLGDKFDKLHQKNFAPEILRKISIKKYYNSETISYVAEEKGKIIGYIRGSASKIGLGSLEIIGVDPDYFEKGVGKKLFEILENFWKRKKQRKISTCVSAHNKRALIFYIKNGFIPEGYRKDHFIEGVDEIILGKFL